MNIKFLSVACAALTLTACGTAMSSRPDALALQNTVGNAADKGILVVDTSGNLGCDSTNLGLVGDNGQFVNMVDYRSTKSGPAVKVVEPGEYRIFSGRCTAPGYYASQMPSLRIWFGDVKVGAGETVYAGTLDTNRVDVKSKLEGMGAVWGALNSFSTKSQSTYLTYEMLDKSADVKTMLNAAEMTDVAERMIYKPPLAILDKGEYESAILRAYAKTSDGKTPTKAEVDERFAKEMETALKNSLRKVADKMGLTSQEIDALTET